MREALLLFAAIQVATLSYAQTNLIENGDFETFTGGVCPSNNVHVSGQAPAGEGWAIGNQSPDHLCSYTGGSYGNETPHVYRADVAHGGNGYGFFYGFAAPTNPESYIYTLASPLHADLSYTFNFWGKSPVNFGNGTFVMKGASGATYVSQTLAGVPSWTNYSFTFTPAVNEAFLILTAVATNEGVALDDLSLSLNSPLPLHLRWFDAALRGPNALLEWEMVEESGLRSFEVERSTDGIGFEGLVSYPATTAFSTHYTFTDRNLPAGQAMHYRLRVVQLNGASRYSRTLTVQRPTELAAAIILYPNPATSAIRISGLQGGGRMRIISSNGTLHYAGEAAGPLAEISTSHLSPGLYFLTYTDGKEVRTQKFRKE